MHYYIVKKSEGANYKDVKEIPKSKMQEITDSTNPAVVQRAVYSTVHEIMKKSGNEQHGDLYFSNQDPSESNYGHLKIVSDNMGDLVAWVTNDDRNIYFFD